MRVKAVLLFLLLASLGLAQVVSRPAGTFKGASPYRIKLVAPWKVAPATNDPNQRALVGDFTGPKEASMTVVAFTKGAPKRFKRFDPRLMKMINEKKVPSRTGVSSGYKYLAYWLNGAHMSTIAVNLISGNKVIQVTAIFARKATKAETEAVLKMAISARV
ncbi:MAG: hypothetical protein K8R88_02410 [Armatimonadetes bacterium]|nr:hypothetical protein [Armatimonadota bacterium]